MRTATTCIALVMAGLALAGCSVQVAGTASAQPAAATTAPSVSPTPTTPAPLPPGTFEDARSRFRIVPPSGWSVDTSGAQGTSVVFIDRQTPTSATARFSSNINVIVVPSTASLDATVTGARNELRGLTNYVQTADEPVVLADGTPAHLLGCTFDDPKTGLSLRNLQLFTVHDGNTLVATGTSLQDVWSRYEQPLDTSLRSLTVAA